MFSNIFLYLLIFLALLIFLIIFFIIKKRKLKRKNVKSEKLTDHFNGWWENEIQVKLKKDKVQKTEKIYNKIKEFDAADADTME